MNKVALEETCNGGDYEEAPGHRKGFARVRSLAERASRCVGCEW